MRAWPALVLAMAIVVHGRPALAANRPRLVILAVDRLTLQDLQAPYAPNFRRLAAEGAVGLMTTRVTGGLSPDKIYLAIATGGAAYGLPGAGRLIFDADEPYLGLPAAAAYRLQAGAEPMASVLHLGTAGLAGVTVSASNRPGWLGDALIREGLRLAVLGNADFAGNPGREAALLLMSGSGRVALGRVGRATLIEDWRAPGGWRTDYSVLREEYRRLAESADVILVALGDVARVHAAGSSLTPAAAARHLEKALKRADAFLGHVLAGPARPDHIILVVASPPLPRLAVAERLTPAVVWGSGVAPGLAYSASTRRAGIITPPDLAATIARCCGLEPGPFSIGRPIESRPGALADLPAFYSVLVRNYQQRKPVFQAYGYSLLVGVMAALGLSWRGRGETSAARRWRALVTGLAATPTFLLLYGLVPLGPVWVTLAAIALSALAIGSILTAPGVSAPVRLAAVCLGSTALILFDVVCGSRLLGRSLMGYSPISGARFYGLGNEYLGAVLGAAILGGTALAALLPRGIAILPVFFGLTALIIALPHYGANVGGSLTAVAGLGYTYYQLNGRRIGWREIGTLILAAACLLGVMVLSDLSGAGGGPSHLGQAWLRARAGGLLALAPMLQSKLSLNARLFSYTAWNWVMLGLLALGPVLLRHPPPWLAVRLPLGHPLAKTAQGLLVTALIGLLVNDSGVVVAGTIMIYFGLALVHLFDASAGRWGERR